MPKLIQLPVNSELFTTGANLKWDGTNLIVTKLFDETYEKNDMEPVVLIEGVPYSQSYKEDECQT